jgi:hypothetical protein
LVLEKWERDRALVPEGTATIFPFERVSRMSRSHRHTPIFGITVAESEAEFKRASNRRLRLQARMALEKCADLLPERPRDCTDIWTGPKDGKQYLGAAYPKSLRK